MLDVITENEMGSLERNEEWIEEWCDQVFSTLLNNPEAIRKVIEFSYREDDKFWNFLGGVDEHE